MNLIWFSIIFIKRHPFEKMKFLSFPFQKKILFCSCIVSCNIYAKAPPKVLTQNLGWPLYVKVHILWQGTPTIKEIPGVYKTFIYIHQSRTNCITFSNRQYLTIFNTISIFGNIQYQVSEINYQISSLIYPVLDTVYQSILAVSNYFETFWFHYYYY